ncbi:hypothetical protein [Nitrospirillum iridis]|uniref:Uncharacterized protein n=1 Tax=Nitrospirillum iridis TaxID=765888 RepID=A0A7X0EDZ2_9PROT|nr:hypothetical protein [Nitrospirillum iridis]MBB6253303.1 hypothetical protein [Nitrospirillum iridis]
MKTSLFAAMVAAALLMAGAAGAAPATTTTAAAPAYSTSETDIGTLLDNAQTKAVLVKFIPDTVANPQFEQARAMTLKQVQAYAPDKFSDDLLVKIDAELAKVTPKP